MIPMTVFKNNNSSIYSISTTNKQKMPMMKPFIYASISMRERIQNIKKVT